MIINQDEFAERVSMLSEEVMAEVIEIFKEGYPERKSNIRKALEDKSPDKLEFEIHALKNDLSQFAANALSDKTEWLLQKVRTEKTVDVIMEIDDIEKTIENKLIPELNSWYSGNR
ncbi:MAG: Hpt domain-containing protein [Bacteroidales bacterium]|nr:Hpt domain-containing protein [Bacteroidales bacterium]